MADGQGFGPSLAGFDWEDPFRLNDQLTEDERMLRDAARAYAQDKLQPRVIAAYRDETTDPSIFREMGEMGLLGVHDPRGIWRPRRKLRRLRAGRARDRAGRFRLSLDDVGAVEPRDVSDLRLRNRRAATQIPAEAGVRRMDRLLRPDRTRRRVRPGAA